MINQLPSAPLPTDSGDTFDSKAFALVAALSTFVTQANATAAEMQQNSDIAAAMLMGMSLPQYAGTSATSAPIATGAVSLQTQSGKAWMPGQVVIVANGSNYLKGTVTAYSGTQLDVNVTSVAGSGTFASWSIGLTYAGLLLASSGANSDITSLGALTAINGGQIGGLRNRLINGAMGVDQRNKGASQTFTVNGALAYSVDRWYGYCTGTGSSATGQRVAGTSPNQYNYRFTGAAGVTKIGFAQRIEAANSQDLAGKTVTLSVDLANSVLTTVAWTAWYANTADTFGTLAAPTRTAIAVGSFTVGATLGRYSTQIAIPAAATTGIEIEFSVGAQTSGTWTIGRAQLELGSVATAFEVRPMGGELDLCRRYWRALTWAASNETVATGYATSTTTAVFVFSCDWLATMRTTSPAVTYPSYPNWSATGSAGSILTTASAVAGYLRSSSYELNMTFSAAGLTFGQGSTLVSTSPALGGSGAFIRFDAEL